MSNNEDHKSCLHYWPAINSSIRQHKAYGLICKHELYNQNMRSISFAAAQAAGGIKTRYLGLMARVAEKGQDCGL